jgi:hypothetical protein
MSPSTYISSSTFTGKRNVSKAWPFDTVIVDTRYAREAAALFDPCGAIQHEVAPAKDPLFAIITEATPAVSTVASKVSVFAAGLATARRFAAIIDSTQLVANR